MKVNVGTLAAMALSAVVASAATVVAMNKIREKREFDEALEGYAATITPIAEELDTEEPEDVADSAAPEEVESPEQAPEKVEAPVEAPTVDDETPESV